MDDALRTARRDLWTADRAAQNEAFQALVTATAAPVPWAYELWDELLENLEDRDNHNRAIAAQILCNLAKSDPEGRMTAAIPALLRLTKDSRFVTARHCLQSLWKVGAVGGDVQDLLTAGLARRYAECVDEKNGTLTRYDIVESFRKMYDATGDERLRAQALELVVAEDDAKYRKKYAGLWRMPRVT